MGNKGTLHEAKMDMKDQKNRPETDQDPQTLCKFKIQSPDLIQTWT